MTPEAVRARARRKKERQARGNGSPDASRFRPADYAAASSAAPADTGPSPEARDKAVKWVKGALKGAGFLAGMLLRDDDMRVPETDAQETAELIVDGWPELADVNDEDARKVIAIGAVFSLVVQRAGSHMRKVEASKPIRTVAAPMPGVELPHPVGGL